MRRASRNDTALHRNTHDERHATNRYGRLQYHLGFAAWRPLRSLDELLDEIERIGWTGNRAILLRARTARDGGWPYLLDEVGDVWR